MNLALNDFYMEYKCKKCGSTVKEIPLKNYWGDHVMSAFKCTNKACGMHVSECEDINIDDFVETIYHDTSNIENKDSIETAIKDIVTCILSNDEKEINEKYKEIIQEFIRSGYDLKNAETFDVMIRFQIDNIMNLLISSLNPEISSSKNKDAVQFLFLHYSYLNENIEKLISKKEGHACSADKSRHLLEMYKEYLLTGNIPELENQKHFWIFSFGTYPMWFDFCDSLWYLYYGNPSKYLTAYKNLLECKSRVFRRKK